MVAKGEKIVLWVATIETVDVPKVAIWNPFRIPPYLAEKSTTLDITNSWNFWIPCRFGVHSIWLIRNTSNICLVMFLFFPANLTSPGCLLNPYFLDNFG